ncbi:MAG: wax ester/triacylglycerol synthase family O-acyltransferase [Alphaproteobacteria bacterium]|nr:wax ester/triacylglycerol synthase family O-acyltransferase [Alphaproteobacteria bacterium]
MLARELVSGVDAAWLHMESPQSLMMITGVMWFDAPADWQAVSAVLQERMIERYPRFRQRVVDSRVGRGPVWEDDPEFSLERQVSRVRLPGEGGHDTLERLVEGLLATPLDPERPLWHFHFVDNYLGGSALLGRLHHCIADGIALARVLLSLSDPIGVSENDPPEDEGEHGGPSHLGLRALGHKLKRTAKVLAHESIEAVQHRDHWLGQAAHGAEAVTKLITLPDEPKTVFRGHLGIAKRAAWSHAFSLAEIKRLGRAAGATVNDVLLACVAGALRRYMLRRDGPVVDVTTFVPVNLRPLDGPIELGNRFGLVFLTLPVSFHTPLGRLRELKRRMDVIKDSPEALLAYGLLAAMGQAPTGVEHQVVRLFGRKASAVMTNVPGPRQPIALGGHEVGGLMFWVPQSGGVGMGVSIFSYNGSVLLGVTTDAGLVDRPAELIELAEEEFAALDAELGATSEDRR